MDFALFLEYFFIFVSAFGHPFVWVLIGAMLYWKGHEKQSFFLVTALVSTGVLVGVLKNFFMFARPSVLNADSFFGKLENRFSFSFDQYSFPSGHAATVAAAYGFLREKLSKVQEFFFLTLMLGVSYSRVFLNRHFAADVIAGLLVGVIIGRLVWFFFEKYLEKYSKNIQAQEEFGLIITGFLLVAVFFLFESLSASAILIGYYFGVFLFKLSGHDNPTGMKRLDWYKKTTVGFLGVIAIISPIAVLELPLYWAFTLLFFAGFWMTFLFPIAYDKALKNKTRTK